MTPCDAARLRQLLADELPDALQTEVAEHVAGCERCRQALELFAGDAAWWAEVQSCLKENESVIRHLADAPALERSSPADSHAGDDTRDIDFVVDFLEPCDEAHALGRLGEYEILEVIGRGGMGVVLKGFQRELGRYVAVKVMAPHLASSGAARARFVREARAAAAIVHPNVMPIHSVSTASRLPYLVMPFLACESLQQRLDRQGPLELKEVLRIGHQAAGALAAAHAQGLVHRDVKPANILLETGVDRVLLTDFGLARAIDDGALTRTGVVAGTPQYMSPEQSQGEPIDERSDLFSLGSVLYAQCTGRPPFRAETALGVLRRICDTGPRSIREIQPELPEWLEKLIGRLHEKSPAARFQSAGEVARILEQCLAHVQQPTTAPLPAECQPVARTARISLKMSAFVRKGLVFLGGGLVVAGMYSVSGLLSVGPNAESSRRESMPNDGHEPVDEATLSSANPDQATDWDPLQKEIESFGNDLRPLEAHAEELWETRPAQLSQRHAK